MASVQAYRHMSVHCGGRSVTDGEGVGGGGGERGGGTGHKPLTTTPAQRLTRGVSLHRHRTDGSSFHPASMETKII